MYPVTAGDKRENVQRHVCLADASVVSLPNGAGDSESLPVSPPLPPPLPPAPTTPHIARRASLQDHKVEDRKKITMNVQKSTGDMLSDIDNVKLRPIARYFVTREKTSCITPVLHVIARVLILNRAERNYIVSIFFLQIPRWTSYTGEA